MLNFAYGSNMPVRRIQARDRVPGARLIGTGRLAGYRLTWHKRSQDGSGKCNIVPAKGSVVHGVLYDIPESEKPALDRAEGLGHGYEEQTVIVETEGGAREALAYVATDIDEGLRPYTWYKAFVVAGAREHDLPPDYVAALETCEATEDPDRSRHRKNMEIVFSK